MNLEQLKEILLKIDFNEPIDLGGGILVINPNQMIRRHIAILERNKGNKTFMPYYDRLIQIYKHINQLHEKNK